MEIINGFKATEFWVVATQREEIMIINRSWQNSIPEILIKKRSFSESSIKKHSSTKYFEKDQNGVIEKLLFILFFHWDQIGKVYSLKEELETPLVGLV